MPPFRAVLFDLGGVVFDSPFAAMAEYEAERHMPPGSINRVISETGPNGAWGRNERGEVTLGEFLTAFQAELDAADLDADVGELMERIREALRPRPAMFRAIRRIREEGLRAVAVTNNWREDDGTTSAVGLDRLFDEVIESAVTGVNKPDPRIYEMALEAVGCRPEEAIFLDDIGRNLKSAAALGIVTIKVTDPDEGLAGLESLLGFSLA